MVEIMVRGKEEASVDEKLNIKVQRVLIIPFRD